MKNTHIVVVILAIIAMTTVLVTHIIVCGTTDHEHDAGCGTRTITTINKDGTKKVVKETGCEG